MKKIVTSIVVLLLIAGCESPQVILDNFVIGINTSIMDYTAGLRVYDIADPGKTINGLEIVFFDENSDDVYNTEGRKNFEFNSDNFIAIGLHRRANLADDSEVKRLKFKVSAPGYVDYRGSITVSYEEFDQFVNIPLLNFSNPPVGVQFKEQQAALAGGVSATPLNFELPTTDSVSVGMSIELPASTYFLSADGDTLSGSSLNVQVGQFDPSNETALPG